MVILLSVNAKSLAQVLYFLRNMYFDLVVDLWVNHFFGYKGRVGNVLVNFGVGFCLNKVISSLDLHLLTVKHGANSFR